MSATLPTRSARARAWTIPSDPLALGRRAMLVLVCGFVALSLLAAALIPYHDTDAFLYGEWSRRIGQTGGFSFPTIPSLFYHRPLFYVGQGWLWHVFGYHERLGRLWAFCFGALLLWTVMRLADPRGRLGGGRALLAAVLLIATPDFARYASAGMTDVPVAAMVGLCGVLIWRAGDRRPWRLVAIALASAAAVLTKPTALPALAGLAAADLIGPRGAVRTRLRRNLAPLAAGVAVAVAYDAIEAHRVHRGLVDFLTAGTGDFYGQLSSQVRRGAVLGLDWLGPYLLVALGFALVYGVARAAGARHRPAVLGGVPAAAVLSWVAPMIGYPDAGLRVGLVAAGKPGATVGSFLLMGLLLCAVWAPATAVPTRATMARLLVWAAPSIAAWAVGAPYYTRFLAPAWPALFVLIALVVWPALAGAAARHRVAAVAGAALLCALAVLDLRNFDSLGARPDGSIDSLRALRDLPGTDLLDEHAMRAVADPALAGLVDAVDRAAGPRGRIITPDGRAGYFWLDRVRVTYPTRCSDLAGFRVLALLTERTAIVNEATLEGLTAKDRLIADPNGPTNPAFWRRCRRPALRVTASRPGAYTVLRVG